MVHFVPESRGSALSEEVHRSDCFLNRLDYVCQQHRFNHRTSHVESDHFLRILVATIGFRWDRQHTVESLIKWRVWMVPVI